MENDHHLSEAGSLIHNWANLISYSYFCIANPNMSLADAGVF